MTISRNMKINGRARRQPQPRPRPAADKSAKSALSEPDDSSERAWSKRFIEAKARVQDSKSKADALQLKLNDLNMKLLRQSDVLDRENVYGPLIAQTKQQIEENKTESAAAQQALEDLREELRKSGNPVSWENSEAALKPDPKAAKPEEPKIKDQKYWQEKLAAIDKRYNAMISPSGNRAISADQPSKSEGGRNADRSRSAGHGRAPSRARH